MPQITVPPDTEHPEHWSVMQILLRAGERPTKVVRLMGAGDAGAIADVDGVPRETVLFVTDRGPRTALLRPTKHPGVLLVWSGWTTELPAALRPVCGPEAVD